MSSIQKLACNICGNHEIDLLAKSKNREEVRDIVRCKSCQLTFVNPLPTFEELQKIYNGLYSDREEHNVIDVSKQEVTRKAFVGYLNKLKELNANSVSTFADIGGGLGYYSEAAQHHGLDVTLFEPDQVSAKFAKEVLDVSKTYTKSLDDFITETKDKFDVVLVRHVIEHVPDPDELIRGASKLVKEGGFLIIETPNNLSLEIMLRPRMLMFFLNYFKKNYINTGFLRFCKRRIYALRPPNHLFAFRISNLESLLKSHKLESVSSFTNMIGDTHYWPNTNKSDLRMIFQGIKQMKLKPLVFGLADILLYPLRLISHLMGRSSGLCIYAIKRNES